MKWFLAALAKYAVFAGRAQRSEYWYFLLFFVLGYVAVEIVEEVIGLSNPRGGIGMLSAIFLLGLLLPSWAVTVRRLHDTGRSGWWALLGAIPVLGGIALLVLAAQDSQPVTNEYGPCPKQEGKQLPLGQA